LPAAPHPAGPAGDLKWLDRALQRMRIRRAAPFIGREDAVLDIGCADGSLFTRLPWIREGVGIDPDPGVSARVGITLRRGQFPDALAPDERFDVLTALAVLEHVPAEGQRAFAKGCRQALRPGGRLVLTVPAPLVDRLLDVLIALRVLRGMEAEEHWGFSPATTVALFSREGFRLETHRRFELGLNHLFVFRAP